ncbi:hypothetical protein GV828_05350 [Flavobacterium sp. NST-5]|uniref:SHOCT domain-containing protein n=1 Tax=Flavobacterium ichthyis TaxID=2698827 RepID=A0ABW9Z944_9FLAO|nr:hypothetical protein [Flavobacterium ichthyis]NBL64625.1 hypothetical protein [Flavobacterium ichthyis]
MMKTKKENPENFAIPGKPMSEKKFKALIKEAEKGEFYTDGEFRARFEEWKKSLKK